MQLLGIFNIVGNTTLRPPSRHSSPSPEMAPRSSPPPGGFCRLAVVSATSTSLNVNCGFRATGAQTMQTLSDISGTGYGSLTSRYRRQQKFPERSNGQINAWRIAAAGGTVAGCLLLLLIPGIRKKRWPAALVMLVFLSVGARAWLRRRPGRSCAGWNLHRYCDRNGQRQRNITGSTTFACNHSDEWYVCCEGAAFGGAAPFLSISFTTQETAC